MCMGETLMDADVMGLTGTVHGRSSVGSLAVSELCTPWTLTLQRPIFRGSFLFSTIPVYISIIGLSISVSQLTYCL